MSGAMIEADLVLHNGKILTVDDRFSIASALAVRGDRLVAVGDEAAVKPLIGAKTRVVDLKGRTVIPGLHDSHMHTMNGGQNELAVSLAKARSIADVQAAFAARAATVKKGDWIMGGSGWHENQLAEGRLPVRQELDAATPDNPVYLKRGGHVAVVNSLGLKLANITKDTPNPRNGIIVRDPTTGEPTGVLVERAAFNMVLGLVPPPSRDDRVKGLKLFNGKLNRFGITATLEPGLSLDEISAYMELWRQGGMTTRVRILQRVFGADDVLNLSAFLAPDFGDDWLRVGGFKYSADGGIEGAALKERYRLVEGEQNDPDYHGKLVTPPGGRQEFRQMLENAATRGWQFQVHNVGDAAIAHTVEVMEELAENYPLDKLRWTIVHIFLPSQESLAKIKRLGLSTTVQDHPVSLGYNMLRFWGEERAAKSIPVRSITSLGIPTGGGTDGPTVDWNPFKSLWWMTTRQVVVNNALRTLGPEEAIGREEALRLYTMGSARVGFMEDKIGSLEPGKLADLAVLSDDYMSVTDDALLDLRSVMTAVGGKIVHEEAI
jgi:predicted amidohydrolase YtcJ